MSEEITSGHSSSGERSMTSFEETSKPKKLSSKFSTRFYHVNFLKVEFSKIAIKKFYGKAEFLFSVKK